MIAWYDTGNDKTGEKDFDMTSTEGHILEEEEMKEPEEKTFEKRTKKDKLRIPRYFSPPKQMHLRRFRGQR